MHGKPAHLILAFRLLFFFFKLLYVFPIWHQSFSLCLHRTHLSWSVCPSPSPRKRAWHVSVLVKTTVERRATSPCNHPLHHRPPAVLLTHTRHRRVKKAREGWKEATDRRGGKKKERERDSGRAFGTSGLCFSSGTVCCYVALGTFKRGLGRVNNDGKIGGKNGPL